LSFLDLFLGLFQDLSAAQASCLTADSYRVWQSCTGSGTVEKARKIVLAFPASYAKLLQGLAKTTVLSQRIFNGVG